MESFGQKAWVNKLLPLKLPTPVPGDGRRP